MYLCWFFLLRGSLSKYRIHKKDILYLFHIDWDYIFVAMINLGVVILAGGSRISRYCVLYSRLLTDSLIHQLGNISHSRFPSVRWAGLFIGQLR